MKKNLFIIFIISGIMISCSLFQETIKIDNVIEQKEVVDKTENPAKKNLIKLELSNKRIEITDAIVKDITISTNVDYEYCVIVDVVYQNKKIECYVYSSNIKLISELEKGKTKVDIKGEFSRFFSMLDDYYTKIDIIDAKFNIK